MNSIQHVGIAAAGLGAGYLTKALSQKLGDKFKIIPYIASVAAQVFAARSLGVDLCQNHRSQLNEKKPPVPLDISTIFALLTLSTLGIATLAELISYLGRKKPQELDFFIPQSAPRAPEPRSRANRSWYAIPADL